MEIFRLYGKLKIWFLSPIWHFLLVSAKVNSFQKYLISGRLIIMIAIYLPIYLSICIYVYVCV